VIPVYRAFLFFSLIKIFAMIEATPLTWEGSAEAALLMNADTGAILYEKNADQLRFPASTTKIATALYVAEKKRDSLGDIFTATWDAAGTVSAASRLDLLKHPPYRLEVGGTHMSIRVGEQLSIETLLHGLMMVSANDAANVLAESISGSVPQFMEELNQYLREIGCTDTLFVNPHGLPAEQHVTTARDLGRMAQVLLRDPLLAKVVSTVSIERPATNRTHSAATIWNSNRLLRRGRHHYPKAIGIKTGFTETAGHNLVAAAREGDRTLIAVVMGCRQRGVVFEEATQLFETAFQQVKVKRTLFAHEQEQFSCQFPRLTHPLHAHLATDVVWDYYPAEEPLFEVELSWIVDGSSPIKQQQLVGYLLFKSPSGVFLERHPLYASRAVTERWIYCWMRFMKQKSAFALITLGLLVLILVPLLTILRRQERCQRLPGGQV